MTLPDGAYVTPQGWVVIGDEAYLPEDVELLERRRAQQREYQQRPEVKERKREQHRRWAILNADRRREYNREWMWRKRHGSVPRPVAALHDLRCTGPTPSTGCRCKKIPMYRSR